MAGLYVYPDTAAPSLQGDILDDVSLASVSYSHKVIQVDTRLEVEECSGLPQDDLAILANVRLVRAIVISQSCDVGGDRVLVAPLSEFAPQGNQGRKKWREVQRAATSLHQPSRVYLPDDPRNVRPRSWIELGDAFTTSPEMIRDLVKAGKRIATLTEEGRSYLQFRVATMFARVGRDDYAWPSQDDLGFKKEYLDHEIVLAEEHAKQATSKGETIEADEYRRDADLLRSEKALCEAALRSFTTSATAG